MQKRVKITLHSNIVITLVTCLKQIVLCTFCAAAQSVSSLDIFSVLIFSAHIKLLYIDINDISLYRIAYKKIYIDISYKLDIPPSLKMHRLQFSCLISDFFGSVICRYRFLPIPIFFLRTIIDSIYKQKSMQISMNNYL